MKLKIFTLPFMGLLLNLSISGIAMAEQTLRVGTLGGPYEQITDAAASAAPQFGIKIEPIVLDGMVSPNEMLVGGDLEANAYQHSVFLNTDIARRHYKLIKIADIYQVPLAIYSKKYKSIKDIPDGGKIAIPADESNQSRALIALQYNGLIKLRAGFDWHTDNASVDDVAENPHKFEFVEVPVTVLPNSLPDVDAGVVNALIAYQLARLTLKDAIGVESPQATKRYTQILVIREADKNKPWVAPLIKAYHSDAVRNLITGQFKNLMTPAF